MRRWYHPLIPVFVVAIFASVTDAAWAQKGPARVRARVSGKLKGIRGDIIHVVGDQNENWLVQLPKQPDNVYYENGADASWLKPGMYVQFATSLDRRGKSNSPVGELKVLALRKGQTVGLQAEAGGGAGGLFSETPENARTRRRKRRSWKHNRFSSPANCRR